MPLPQSLDPSNALLFLGSGFSSTAKNIANSHPPVGAGLAKEFERQLGIKEEGLGLKILADEMARRRELCLYQTLYNLFTISSLSAEQEEILSRRWLRIFTTNYDDAVELAYQLNRIACPSFSYNEPIPRKIPTGSIVHVHGAIRKTTEDNVRDQLVLNENSYIRQLFERSAWYGELDRCLDHCSACFFVGYSLSDYHIAALLMEKPGRKDKTFFITLDMPGEIPRLHLEQFGEIHPIGTSGFAELCRTLPAPPPITDLRMLRSVRYLDPFRDQKAVNPPTPGEVLRLVTYGDFNPQRCFTNLPAATYVVPRNDLATEAVENLKEAKTLIIHSYLGNGKTIFLISLAYFLSVKGYKTFMCTSAAPEVSSEIKALRDQEKLAIIFDSYDLALATIQRFEEIVPHAKYVVAVRTGVQDVRLHEVVECLPAPIRRVDINRISQSDKNTFRTLLDEAGVLGSHSTDWIDRSSSFREIVTSLYRHEGIRAKIESDIAPLLADAGAKAVLLAGLLLSWIGQTFEPALLRTLTERDPYVELRRHAEVASEIFRLDDDRIEVRSPVFAEYLLRTHCSDSDIVSVVERLLLTSVQRKRERGFGGILSKLMRVGTLKELLSGADRLGVIEALFRRLQRDIDVNAEPLFWLQYAILASERTELAEAEGFLGTAYARASASPGFETYQIDTYALGLLLRIEEQSQTVNVARFEDIIDRSERVLSMLSDQSRRLHAIQVLKGIEPFALARAHALSTAERNILVFQINRLERALECLSEDEKVETGSIGVRRKLEEATRHVLRVEE